MGDEFGILMQPDLIISEARKSDWRQLAGLYPAAFPDEDLLPLLKGLLNLPSGFFSVVAMNSDELVGHAGFTLCGVAEGDAVVGLVGPVAVSPHEQRQGVGSALMSVGMDALARYGAAKAFVFGDPAYYHRFGFTAEKDVTTPCPIPPEWREAWQSISLSNVETNLAGTLVVPRPWQVPTLWGA